MMHQEMPHVPMQPGRKVWLRRFITGSILGLIILWGILSTLTQPVSAEPAKKPALAAATHIVISEFRFIGSAGVTDEFVEIFNPTDSPVNIEGWKIRTSDNAGTLVDQYTFPAGKILSPGRHYLIIGSGFDDGVSPDGTLLSDIANDGGVAITLANDTVIDAIGLSAGAGAAFGVNVPVLGVLSDVIDQGYDRNPGIDAASCDDTDSAIDFHFQQPSKPQNSASVLVFCPGVLTVTPTQTSSPTPTATPSMMILINEVAWSGTKANIIGEYGEWIELYNPGSTSVTLDNWTLTAASGSPSITLKGSIPGGGYFLLERIDLGIPLDSNFVGAPDQTYSGQALADSGDRLYLRDDNDVLIDTANGNGGAWPAGNITNRCSMERTSASAADTDSNWYTPPDTLRFAKDIAGNWVCGSPKNANWAYTVTATPSNTPSITPSATATATASKTPLVTSTRTATKTPGPSPTRTKSPTPQKSSTPTPNRATPEPIVLNEFLPQPRTDWNGDGKVDSGDEFIELKNLSTIAISISGYKLDDQEGDSLPYTIKDVTMQPGTRKVFFASETGILLSTGGDSVRLYKPFGSLPSDAYTYGVIKIPDQSWCRLPDDAKSYFDIKWKFGCQPTINEPNKLAESLFVANRVEATICLSKNLPFGIYLAECDPLGLEMWSQSLWDALPPDFPHFFDLDAQEYILE